MLVVAGAAASVIVVIFVAATEHNRAQAGTDCHLTPARLCPQLGALAGVLVVAGVAASIGVAVFARIMAALGTGIPVSTGAYAIAALVACSHPAVVFATAFVIPVSACALSQVPAEACLPGSLTSEVCLQLSDAWQLAKLHALLLAAPKADSQSCPHSAAAHLLPDAMQA